MTFGGQRIVLDHGFKDTSKEQKALDKEDEQSIGTCDLLTL